MAKVRMPRDSRRSRPTRTAGYHAPADSRGFPSRARWSRSAAPGPKAEHPPLPVTTPPEYRPFADARSVRPARPTSQARPHFGRLTHPRGVGVDMQGEVEDSRGVDS